MFLSRFVMLMDARPDVGYVFCPVMKSPAIAKPAVRRHRCHDVIISGHDFLRSSREATRCRAVGEAPVCYERNLDVPARLAVRRGTGLWSASRSS